jgi:alanyl aminopeptidase
MRLDPRREDFEGSVTIEVEVTAPTSVVWLNAMELEVSRARWVPAGGAEREVRVVPGGAQFVGFVPDAPLVPGAGTLRVDYRGKVNRTEVEGVFAQKEEGEWYLFTQFEAIAARRAFPCFDEPGFKIPWQVTLRVPDGLVALSNTSPVSEKAESGQRTLVFAEARPMPSYLVAVAVGPFDVVDAGSAGRRPTPVRIVVPKGRGKDTAWAVSSTPKLLSLLEEYFDRPHPYEKLDQVAIPGVDFAMEHPGLITYGQSLMVASANAPALTVQQEYASVCAHEIAH